LLEGVVKGMRIPTWITLRQVRLEFGGVVEQIAAGIGEVLECDLSNKGANDPRFCVSILSNKGWEKLITISNGATIIIDYNHLPIRCKFFLDTSHWVRDCPNRMDSKRTKKNSPRLVYKKPVNMPREEPMAGVGPKNQRRANIRSPEQTMEIDGWTAVVSKKKDVISLEELTGEQRGKNQNRGSWILRH
jgi:hypothetical protein